MFLAISAIPPSGLFHPTFAAFPQPSVHPFAPQQDCKGHQPSVALFESTSDNMGGTDRQGTAFRRAFAIHTDRPLIAWLGGKVKPLKAPKKDKKDLDDDDKAFLEKKRAGTSPSPTSL
jgi:hypothetical protein